MSTEQLVILYVFMVVGFGLVSWTIWIVLKAGRAESWPTAPGTIVISKIDKKMSRGTLWYWPEIRYEYSVNGQLYQSGIWRLGAKGAKLSWSSVARKIVARYPSGKAVAVFYNPDNPRDALLEPGKIDWTGFVIGLVFMILPATCIIVSSW